MPQGERSAGPARWSAPLELVAQDREDNAHLANGESNGFGTRMERVGPHVWLSSPRSYRDAERAGALWTLEAGAPRPMDAAPVRAWQALGYSLAYGQAAGLVAIGAPLAPGDGSDPGFVELVRVGAHSGAAPPFAWQSIQPKDTTPGAGFGSGVQWEGGDLWISAPFAGDGQGIFQSGYLAQYRQGVDGFREVRRWTPPAPEQGLRFGEAFVVREDWLAVGVVGAQGFPGISTGAVWLGSLASWEQGQPQVLRPPSAAYGSSHFGASLALDETGEWLFVGAPQSPSGGSVEVFQKSAQGTFVWQRTLRAAPANRVPGFGQTLVCFAGRLWVGAPRGRGAAWMFPSPWDLPEVSALWRGTQARGAFGRSFLPAPGGETCWVSEPGEGIVSDAPAPRGQVWNLNVPEQAVVPFPAAPGSTPGPPGGGMRWLGWRSEKVIPFDGPEEGGTLVAWGLRPGERVRVAWSRSLPGAPAFEVQEARADVRGRVRVQTGLAPSGSPILELRRPASVGPAVWKLPLGP